MVATASSWSRVSASMFGPSWHVRPIASRACAQSVREWWKDSVNVARGGGWGSDLAVGGVGPEAERHAMVDEVEVPREVLEQRVAKERHEVTPAPRGAKPVAEEDEVGQSVLEEERVRAVAADVHLAGRRRRRVGPVRAGISAADPGGRSRLHISARSWRAPRQ